MKQIKMMSIAIITLTIISCGNKSSNAQVTEAMKNSVEILKEVPEMKKEFEESQEAMDRTTLVGNLSMIIGDEGMILRTWDKRKSYIRFFDERIVVRAVRREALKQSLAIKINGDALYNNGDQILYTLDENTIDGAHVEFTFYDNKKGEKGSPIMATSGEFILKNIEDGKFQISYKGKGSQGKYENKKEIDLSFDFTMNFDEPLIKDNRSK